MPLMSCKCLYFISVDINHPCLQNLGLCRQLGDTVCDMCTYELVDYPGSYRFGFFFVK